MFLPSRRLPAGRALRAAVAALFALALAVVPVTAGPAAAATPSPRLTQVDIGWTSACALVADGSVRCWGRNEEGQLGNGTGRNSIVPVTVAGLADAVDVSVGMFHACAVRVGGSVQCWGAGEHGALGNGSTADRLAPVTVAGISTALGVSVGNRHACAVIASGKVRCWGWNSSGQLGDGTLTDRTTPVTVRGITTATGISAGWAGSCARLSDAGVRCWGYNGYGQLGDGTTTDRRTPVVVAGITTAVNVGIGAFHACATLVDGTIRCWGSGANGVLGNGGFEQQPTPVSVSGISTATQVQAGFYQSCARLADGSARCWGDNEGGQLGDGTNTPSSVPVEVSGVATATGVTTGTNGSCVLLEDSTARCFGHNFAGQLGDRTLTARTVPTPVSWEPDTTRPVASAPTTGIRGPSGVPHGKVPAIVRWDATDGTGGTGIDHYQLQKTRDGGRTWTTVGPRLSRSQRVDVSATGTLQYRVRAWDRAGNASAWATGPVYRPRIVSQESSIVRWTGPWTVRPDDGYLGGSLRWTKTAGATSTWSFTGTSVGVVTTRGLNRGAVEVWVDGVLEDTIDLWADESLDRQLVWARSWPERGTHTIRMVARGSGSLTRVDNDGYAVMK